MPALCPECGNVHPQEVDGSAALHCPGCGRTLLVEPAAASTPYAAQAATATYPGVWTEQEAPSAPSAPSYMFTRPEYLVQRYSGWIVARRWLSTLVDHVTLFIGAIVVLGGAQLLLGDTLYQQTLWLWVPLAGAFVIGYFPVLEGLYGATAGKIVAGLRVVDENGNLPGIGKASIRTAFRLIEVNPVIMGGLIAGVCVLASRNRQRLGDMVAKTYVLMKQDAETARGGTW